MTSGEVMGGMGENKRKVPHAAPLNKSMGTYDRVNRT